MKPARSIIIVLGITVGLGLACWWSGRNDGGGASAAVTAPAIASDPARAPRAIMEEPTLADALNSPSSTIQNDVRLLQDIFLQWQTNFAAKGNPVGTNAEITAALTGKNDLRLDLIPRRHPAINARGEICDRWGTPFRFHQLSGTQMQIISAGPDRDFATEDDVAMP
jgi:hypothetical protein